MTTGFSPSRRTFLATGGSLVVSFALPLGPAGAQDTHAVDTTIGKPLALDQVDTFLAIDAKGHVTLFTGKVDLGTGVQIGLQQIVAEELDVPLSAMSIIEGDTALTPDQGPTYGSFTIQNGGMAIRQAAATARDALLGLAAQKLAADKGALTVVDGVISSPGGGQSSYAQLIGGKDFSLKLDPAAPLKDPSRYKLVGKPIPRTDIPEKIVGKFTFMQDFRLPDMLHGSVVRPPAFGAKLESVDESSVKSIPGYIRLVREGNFLAVVTATEWAAVRAARELKAVWSKSETLPDQSKIWEHVRATKVVKDDVMSNVGDVKTAMAQPGKVLKATYDFAPHTHGSIGPSCAVSEIKDGKLTCWTASQATHNLRRQLAQMLSMPIENVRCIYVAGAGCYGRNGHEDAAGDSALLARALGKPVRVQWSRADEHGWDPKGPPTLMDLNAHIDGAGNVTAWESYVYIPQGGATNVDLVSATLADLPRDNRLSPGGVTNDAAIPYQFPNVKAVCVRLETTPLRPAWIRSPGRLQNSFGNECFVDEIAVALGIDPIEFRLRSIDQKDTRARDLLERLRKLAKWEARPSHQQKGSAGVIKKGRGVSYIKYELVRTYVGMVADVEVDTSLGDVRVTKFYVVQDCGQIINPNGVLAQVEGSVIQTLSRSMKEEVTWDRGMVTSLDWATYPILRFTELPEIEIDLIDRPNEKPWGAGEPAAAVVPSTISNAIFDATGVRLRSVPFKQAKVRAALRAT